MRILVTGAGGFVGGAVVRRLLAEGHAVRGLARDPSRVTAAGAEIVAGDLTDRASLERAVAGCDAVVHAAARVHVMRETVADPLAAFRRVNVEGTIALAEAAARAGVRRFVFISSIKVLGEGTVPPSRYTADQAPNPTDPYGISKWEAEQALRRVAAAHGMEWVVIRPVLVYGPGVGGNFRSLLGWVRKGIPLPLGAVDNRRSYVALGNLVDLIRECLVNPAAANANFLVSDGDDLSTAELLRRTARAMGKRATLLPVPPSLLAMAGRALGRGAMIQRLLGSLQVDVDSTRRRLGWNPPLSVDEGLRAAVEG